MKNPETESQEYLRQVAEQIQKGNLTRHDAIKASTITNGEFSAKLNKCLPFSNATVPGGVCNTVKKGDRILRSTIMPSNTIIKLDDIDLEEYKKQPDVFSARVSRLVNSPEHHKVFRLIDTLPGQLVSVDELLKMILADQANFSHNIDFHMLDWDNNLQHDGNGNAIVTHLTTVNKKDLVHESDKRFNIWKQIHETIEDIAAKTMKDNGITI